MLTGMYLHIPVCAEGIPSVHERVFYVYIRRGYNSVSFTCKVSQDLNQQTSRDVYSRFFIIVGTLITNFLPPREYP